MPLIAPTHVWLLFAAVSLLVVAAFRLEKTRLGGHLSGAVIALLLGMAASNLGLLPASAPLYDAIWDHALPFGLAVLLLRANLHALLRETGRLALLFLAGSAATLIGTLTAHAVLADFPHKTELAGVLTASYIGGSANFLATARILDLDTHSEFLAAGLAADNLVMALYFAALFALARHDRLRQAFAQRAASPAPSEETGRQAREPVFRASHLALVSGLAALICGLGQAAAAAWTPFPGATLLWITALSLAFALTFSHRLPALAIHRELGLGVMQYLFVVIGLSASLPAVLRVGFDLVGFILILLGVHLTLILLAGWLLRFRLEEILIASNANAGGPSTAPAMAAAQRWESLVVPAILCGTLGYAIANFIGLLVVQWLRA